MVYVALMNFQIPMYTVDIAENWSREQSQHSTDPVVGVVRSDVPLQLVF